MKSGKHKCELLKDIRKRIAVENGLPMELPWLNKEGKQACIGDECSFDGPCRGTCPRCEAEVHYLEKRLKDRIRLGNNVTLSGRTLTVAGLSLGLAACGGATEGGTPPSVADSVRTIADSVPIAAKDTIHGEDTICPEITTEGLALPILGVIEVADDSSSNTCDGRQSPDSAMTKNDDYIEEGEVSEGEIFAFVEKEASFPGGNDSLYAWLARNVNYPEQALKEKITGTVVVKFTVEKDGSITRARLIRDIGGGCGKEALRVVKSMPKWKPAMQGGKYVRLEYTLPIAFQMNDDDH